MHKTHKPLTVGRVSEERRELLKTVAEINLRDANHAGGKLHKRGNHRGR